MSFSLIEAFEASRFRAHIVPSPHALGSQMETRPRTASSRAVPASYRKKVNRHDGGPILGLQGAPHGVNAYDTVNQALFFAAPVVTNSAFSPVLRFGPGSLGPSLFVIAGLRTVTGGLSRRRRRRFP